MPDNSIPVNKANHNFKVLIAGIPLSEKNARIQSVWIESRVNQGDEATIVIQQPASAWDFDADVLRNCQPGIAVTIELGYGSYSEPVFSGEVTGQQLQVSNLADSSIIIHCKNATIIVADADTSRQPVLTATFGTSIRDLDVTLGKDLSLFGEVKFQGSLLAKVNSYITLAGLNYQFDNNYFINGLTHFVSPNSWETTASLGLPASG